jgi:hypothetical protein
METALIVAFIGIGGALAGVVGTAFVAIHSQRQTNRREAQRLEHERERLQREREMKEQQLKHERELKQSELEDARQERRREERIKAYRDFYNAVLMTLQMTVHLSAAKPDETVELGMTAATQLSAGLAEIYLIAPPAVISAAEELNKATLHAAPKTDVSSDEMQNINIGTGRFLTAVRKDLGTLPEQLHVSG